MKQIDWEDPKQKSKAYAYLAEIFNVTKSTVSLAMKFKRNSLKAAQMRNVAINELGGKFLTNKDVEIKTTKILNSHGDVIKVITK